MTDLIKREDAVKALAEVLYEEPPYLNSAEKRMAFARNALKGIPSAENKGEWIFKEITDDYHVTGQCSVCKERRRVDNFCPNCGARMKGADDE